MTSLKSCVIQELGLNPTLDSQLTEEDKKRIDVLVQSKCLYDKITGEKIKTYGSQGYLMVCWKKPSEESRFNYIDGMLDYPNMEDYYLKEYGVKLIDNLPLIESIGVRHDNLVPFELVIVKRQ